MRQQHLLFLDISAGHIHREELSHKMHVAGGALATSWKPHSHRCWQSNGVIRPKQKAGAAIQGSKRCSVQVPARGAVGDLALAAGRARQARVGGKY